MKLRPIVTVPLMAVLLAGPTIAFAADNAPPSAASGQAQAQGNPNSMDGTAPTSAAKPDQDSYTQQELDQMLAPIALYPDQLLMNIMMASTYPLQLVEASRWLQDPKNAALKDDQLFDTLRTLDWDPSVKALVAYPQVLDLLNKNLDWTQSLGVAFANQQNDVMTQVQYLRQQASNAGNLKTDDKMVVQNDGPNITIAPASEDVVYVPYYNPVIVYGAWPWPEYRPIWFSDYYCGCAPVFVGGWAWGPRWGIVHPLWGWFGVRWGYGGGVFVHGGFLGRFHVGVFRGGLWHHAGFVGHGGFRGGFHGGVGFHGGGVHIGIHTGGVHLGGHGVSGGGGHSPHGGSSHGGGGHTGGGGHHH